MLPDLGGVVAADGNDVALVAAPTPVRVADVRVNDGSPQRSEVRSLTVTFSGPVTFANNSPMAAFQLTRVTGAGGTVGLSAATSTNGLGQTVVTLTFTGEAQGTSGR